MSEQKYFLVDIGSAWSKAFLVSLDKEKKLSIDKTSSLPTSFGDIPFVVESLKSQLNFKDEKAIYVSHLPEVEIIAKKEKGVFVGEKDAALSLTKFFKQDSSLFNILDGGASNLHETVSSGDIGKHLTFHSSDIFIENFFGKKRFRPHILPLDVKELEIEEAFLREIFERKLRGQGNSKKIQIFSSGGIISGSPRLSRVALLLLDSLPISCVSEIFFDNKFFLPSFGALLFSDSHLKIEKAGDWLEKLGAFVSLGGVSKIQLDWGYSQLQEIEPAVDEISLIPAPPDQKIELTIFSNSSEKKQFKVTGGKLGILIDSRRKPLKLNFGSAESRSLMSGWYKDLEQAELNKEVF